ncbi:hypothetical protein EJB05_47708, partial [Eragrostis curvula]
MQGGSSGIVYGGLKYQASTSAAASSWNLLEPLFFLLLIFGHTSLQARCIADVRAEAGSTTFLAGTLSLKEENEVHLIRLSPAEGELVCDGLFYHPNEIWDLKSCPFDHRVFSTVYTSGEGYGAAVWKIPELYGQSNSPQLEQLFTLDGHTGKIRRKSSAIEHAHIRDVDYNPKKQNIIATAEDEFGIHLWDLRMLKHPLKDLAGHSHWTWAVRHNPEHDELILSAGTDSTVNLWLAKVGSDDSGPESPSGSPKRQEEPLLNSYTDYEDSIYGIAWSSHDPSLFASLSYDGRVSTCARQLVIIGCFRISEALLAEKMKLVDL